MAPILNYFLLMLRKELFLIVLIGLIFSTAHGDPVIAQIDNCTYIGTYNNIPIKIETGSYPTRFLHLTSPKLAVSIYLDQLDGDATLFVASPSSEKREELFGTKNLVAKIETTENEEPIVMGFYRVPTLTEWLKLTSLTNVYKRLPVSPKWSAYQKIGEALLHYQGCNTY